MLFLILSLVKKQIDTSLCIQFFWTLVIKISVQNIQGLWKYYALGGSRGLHWYPKLRFTKMNKIFKILISGKYISCVDQHQTPCKIRTNEINKNRMKKRRTLLEDFQSVSYFRLKMDKDTTNLIPNEFIDIFNPLTRSLTVDNCKFYATMRLFLVNITQTQSHPIKINFKIWPFPRPGPHTDRI
jgi:hypothetical protein